MKIIIGLGNSGKEYQNTRHNVGFMALDHYLKEVDWKTEKLAYTYKTKINNNDILFLKPTTYMNLSGECLVYYVNYYKVDINDILVIQDDMDLELGTTRLKINSSSGGHNGIKDIIKHLNTDNFLRLKIGISKATYDVIDYVLSKFTTEEIAILNDSLDKANSILNDFINGEKVNELMNKYN